MIRLTDQNDKAVYISSESIVAIYDGGKATSIDVGCDEVYLVKESPQEVASKVLEYKLAMIRYQSLSTVWATNEAQVKHGTQTLRDIFNLAGLEDTNDV